MKKSWHYANPGVIDPGHWSQPVLTPIDYIHNKFEGEEF